MSLIIHLKTITKHKIEVGKLCFQAGLYKQGLLHDLSKYSWTELKPGIKYATGHRSPISIQKEKEGYSEAWLHHIHHNKHHTDFWFDPTMGKTVPIPNRYLFESFCDRVAAAKIYNNGRENNQDAYNYFMAHDDPFMGEENAARLRSLLEYYAKHDISLKKMLHLIKQGKFGPKDSTQRGELNKCD